MVAVQTAVMPGLTGTIGHVPSMFERGRAHSIGNDLPPETGDGTAPFRPGPSPSSRGYVVGGQLGDENSVSGTDSRAPHIQPHPHLFTEQSERRNPETSWGLQGFNDKLRVVDRHAFWDRGRQVTGTTFVPAGTPPGTYNNPMQQPPRPDLRTVNRSVTYQIGTDATRNQDDLHRPYTWLGEQGAGWTNIPGGVPGLYIPYGSRGGVPFPVVSPVAEGAPDDGPADVWAGPPHGLHSLTFPDRGDTLDRYRAVPQMQPGRVDRPSNSPQAGQSFSQTVQMQGGPPTASARGARSPVAGLRANAGVRGWGGRGVAR